MANQFEPMDPFPYGTHVHLWLSGHIGKGGAGFVGNESRIGPLQVPSIPFGIMVVLIRRAKADAEAKLESWMPRGFLTKEQIHRDLVQLGVECDSDYSVKYIYRVRRLLDAVLGRGWGSRLLEYRQALGYRLSTPPENQFLDFDCRSSISRLRVP